MEKRERLRRISKHVSDIFVSNNLQRFAKIMIVVFNLNKKKGGDDLL
jgi:hypothetical protein